MTEVVESLRIEASLRLPDDQKSKFGQFFTPVTVARFMASMSKVSGDSIHILDPGAGVGSLFSSLVAKLCDSKVQKIEVTCFEIDSIVTEYLRETMQLCEELCERHSIEFSGEIRTEDFLEYAVQSTMGGLFQSEMSQFDCAIINPPYFKINVNSDYRKLIRDLGVETSNIYTGFLTAATHLLRKDGELIAITPRSFCNGPYFQPFREYFLRQMSFKQIHLFNSRNQAFSDNAVLQENLIFRATKNKKSGSVEITSNAGPTDEMISVRKVPHEKVVSSQDKVIHIAVDELAEQVSDAYSNFTSSLDDIGIKVSTGKVVDFRSRESLRSDPEQGTVPLIYPTHFDKGDISWPKKGSKKPNALVASDVTVKLRIPSEYYVLVKRFSAKEERRRVTAALYDGTKYPHQTVGIENHLNYFHKNGSGLDKDVAKGLLAFLNSSILDSYFRQFSGHTQVNATDLRNMRYPEIEKLKQLGQSFEKLPQQGDLDGLIHRILFNDAETNPINTMNKIEQATQILKDLGLPRQQINERSALTLLALVDLKPDDSWGDASTPLCGITQMMDYFAEHYGKKYKPNTRESVRRLTIHQFLDAGMILLNPDDPERAINSSKTVYQIETELLAVLKQYGADSWKDILKKYFSLSGTLKKKYAQEREMKRIPLKISKGETITLSPGGQNVLVEKIIEDFCPYFTPDAKLIYVGDTDEKYAYFYKEALSKLGVELKTHGQIPDVIVYYTKKKWLVLIEAVTSHGPVDAKRHGELKRMFSKSKAGLVYVTTFLDRKTMGKYLGDISWETEVWVAESPTHMIHFNGERFLGPY